MSALPIQEIQNRLASIVHQLRDGEELELTENGMAVAVLRKTEPARTEWPCKAGSAKHLPFFMADDFNAPLEDFKEYME